MWPSSAFAAQGADEACARLEDGDAGVEGQGSGEQGQGTHKALSLTTPEPPGNKNVSDEVGGSVCVCMCAHVCVHACVYMCACESLHTRERGDRDAEPLCQANKACECG